MKDYLSDNTYNYAVMLDGTWGSGKTYFVKETLIRELQKSNPNLSAIYVSLYGLKYANEIENSTYFSIVESKLGKGRKFLPILSSVLKISAEFLGSKIGSDTVEKTDISAISPFVSFDDYYFIFDDLERCSMPINEVLGYINHFIEQNKAKVIIVANEEEIGSVELPENNIIKLLLSAQDSINWPEQEKTNVLGQKLTVGVNSQKKPDLEEVKWRSKLLSDENSYYLQVKEKLIGQTLYYRPILHDVVPVVLEKCTDKEILNDAFQTKSARIICDIMESEDYFNLRTLQFGLVLFSKICRTVYPDMRNLEYYEDMLYRILEAILKVSIAYKNGESASIWDANSEYGSINLKKQVFSKNFFISFRFIHEYIYNGSYDSERIKKVLRDYHDSLLAEMLKLDDPIYKLQNYYGMEDEEIIDNIKKLMDNLIKGNYKGGSYREILALIFTIKETALEPIPVKEFIQIMEDNVRAGESISTMYAPTIKKQHVYFTDYSSCVEKLWDIEQTKKHEKNGGALNAIFDTGKDWGNEFLKYCINNTQMFLMERGFFKFIDINKCANILDKASVKNTSEFTRALETIYDFNNIVEYYSEDADSIDKLCNKINKNYGSKMKQFNIKLLLSVLESVLGRLRRTAS